MTHVGIVEVFSGLSNNMKLVRMRIWQIGTMWNASAPFVRLRIVLMLYCAFINAVGSAEGLHYENTPLERREISVSWIPGLRSHPMTKAQRCWKYLRLEVLFSRRYAKIRFILNKMDFTLKQLRKKDHTQTLTIYRWLRVTIEERDRELEDASRSVLGLTC